MMAALINWLREEWRLMRAQSWESEAMNFPPAPEFRPCSSEDPRCAETIKRLAECAERMRRMKSRVLDGRKVTCSASTDVRLTIVKARAVAQSPIHAIPRRAAR